MTGVGSGAKLRQLAAGIVVVCSLATGCASTPKESTRTPYERAIAYLDVGNGALTDGDMALALQHLLEAEKLDPTIPQIHHSKALAFYAKGDVQSAIACAREAVRLNPKYSEGHNTLGRLLMESGRTEEALTHLKTAAADPIYREAYKPLTNLGIIYYRKGEYAEAERHLKRAISEKADGTLGSCVAHYYLGHLHVKEGKLKDAIAAYDRASRRICGSFGDAHLALGIALERNREYDKARRKFLEIQDQFPSTPIASKALERLKSLP